MSTKNPRFSVMLDQDKARYVQQLSHFSHHSVSYVLAELISEAIEMREDIYLSQLANQTEAESQNTIAAEEVWKICDIE